MRETFGHNAPIHYRVGKAKRLPSAYASVDYAFANMYLHHVEHPVIAIKEMARIVKPGGRVVITDLDEHTFEFLVAEQHDRWMGFKREDVKRWFEDAGLDGTRHSSSYRPQKEKSGATLRKALTYHLFCIVALVCRSASFISCAMVRYCWSA